MQRDPGFWTTAPFDPDGVASISKNAAGVATTPAIIFVTDGD